MSRPEPAPLSAAIKSEPHLSLAAFFNDLADQCAAFGRDAAHPFAKIMAESVRQHIVAAGVVVAIDAERGAEEKK